MVENGASDRNVSVGEENQLRDEQMLEDKLREEAIRGGYGADATNPRGEQNGVSDNSNVTPPRRKHVFEEEYLPGQAAQPDRSDADGLTGPGPVQY